MYEIYNIIAELCALIINSRMDDSLFLHYSCISAALRDEIRNELSDNITILFDTGSFADGENRDSVKIRVRQLRSEDLNKDIYKELSEYISVLNDRSEYFKMMGLLQVLDESLKTILYEKIKEYQDDSFTVVLNTNRESTGIGLLPRCSCVWERKNRIFRSYNSLDNFLFNLLLIENSILGEMIDKHIFLKRDLFPDFNSSKRIKIAASPLREERYFEELYYEKNSVQYFGIEYEGIYFREENEAVWQKIIRASENKCDIIVFPEVLGNPLMKGYISERLRSLPESEQDNMPSLIILPSCWEKNMNTVTVLDKRGNVICDQCKQNPFRTVKNGCGYLEDIKSNMVVNILHYDGIGRIAILICRDFLTTKYMEQLMRCFKLTLIIVPSFSTGSYDFRQSFDLCAHDDCNVIWINTCAAFEDGKEDNFRHIGYVRKRIGRNDDDSQKLCEMPICENAFRGDCRHDCFFCETIQGV